MDSVFLTSHQPQSLQRVKQAGMKAEALRGASSWGEEDLVQTLEQADRHECSAVVVDSDHVEYDYLEKLRKSGFFVCAIKDSAPYAFPCHMVVNGNADAQILGYQSATQDTVFLLGPKYAILRPEFWQPPSRAFSDRVDRVLVTMGGADPFYLTAGILELLDALPGTFSVSAVIGPFFEHVEDIERAAQGSRREVTLHRSPDSVYHLMLEADLAVSAGGQTLYELACAGCPTVALRMASNQDGQLAVFERAGFLKIAGPGDGKLIVERIRTLLLSLLSDPHTRKEMGRTGRGMVDGRGGERIAAAIHRALGLPEGHSRASAT